jgi:adenine nucleotide transporter 17
MTNDSVIHSVAGAAGGILAMTATYPLVFLSTRAANETKGQNKSTYQVIVDVLKRDGFQGLYNGLNSSLLGIAVTNGSCITTFTRVQRASSSDLEQALNLSLPSNPCLLG